MGINKIGKYEVIDILGRGGMGVVYSAIDRGIGRKVAIKTLTEAVAGDTEMLQRFYREAEKTGVLNHPNIVTVYDLGQQDGSPYIVMEFLEGESLDEIIRSSRPITLASKLKIIAEVCSALGYAHRHNVIHRDVKPANVMVQPDGTAKLLDFGIAHVERRDLEAGLTGIGNVIGTAPYMAPERLRGEAFDGRSDIFSAGVMLYQLLTGKLPFGGDGASFIQKLFCEKHAPLGTFLEGCPEALNDILDNALAKDPSERYSTADEMAADIALVAREVKKDEVLKMLPQAERLVVGHEYTRAREILLEILRIDTQHMEAKRLLSEVHRQIKRRQREDRIQQLRLRAEDARRDQQFERAIENLEEALVLDPSDVAISGMLEAVRQQKRTIEQLAVYLRKGDAARQIGDFEQAKVFVQKAMELDKQNSKVIAAFKTIEKEAAEAGRKDRARRLIESARLKISSRHFEIAIGLLKEAERLDSSTPELQALLDIAARSLEQEKQRRLADEFQDEAAGSINAVLEKVRAFMEAKQFTPAKQILESLSPATVQAVRIQAALNEVRHADEQEGVVLQLVGRAYSALAKQDIQAGRANLAQALRTGKGSALVQRMSKAFEARQKTLAEHQEQSEQSRRSRGKLFG